MSDTPGPTGGAEDHGHDRGADSAGYDADYLVEQYVTGRLTRDEAARLLAMLEARPGLADGLIDQVGMDAMLRGLGRSEVGEPDSAALAKSAERDSAVGPPAGRPRRAKLKFPANSPARLLATAACIALVLAAGAVVWSIRRAGKGPATGGEPGGAGPAQVATDEPTTAAVAVLARTVDAVWADSARSYPAGAPLEPGRLQLRSGLIEVAFYSGARVVLEGPGELELRSPVEAFCPAGRLSAEVPPPARGFRIGTPRGEVVDLGTAFGLDVTGGGAEVHVFKGRVELHPNSQGMRGLKEGEAATIGRDGSLRLFAADASVFPSPAALDRKAGEATARRLAVWQAAGAGWNADPDLVVRFDFEGLTPGDFTLLNRASGGVAGTASNGAAPDALAGPATLVGCGRADGRWPGKGALEFRAVSDRVRFGVPGEMSSATFLAWVRVDGLDRRFNSLCMADAFAPGAAHWQVLNNGRVRLGVATKEKPGVVNYDSPVVFTPERLGRWVQLAVVYDAAAARVVHYVDGRPEGAASLKPGNPLRLGSAGLGNWDPGRRSDSAPIRHFSGRMDEFALYRRALGDAEIARMYAVGSGAAGAGEP